MGYDNTLFNGKSMRNAIITKLSEDKHLTSALFANSNITILIDILSYMYQCLLSNLRQAASESMWSDTIFFENAARLAKLIGYYAKGQLPYTMLAKIYINGTGNAIAPEYGTVSLGYGPYKYKFSVVEHNVNNNKNLIRLALGEWKQHSEKFESDGTKFQEFVVERDIYQENKTNFISQKYVRVFTRPKGPDNDDGIVDLNDSNIVEWTYSPNPLFLIQNEEYSDLNSNNPTASRTQKANLNNNSTRLFNFYINENGDYILKFGDGICTSIPPKGYEIIVMYVVSSETDKTITQTIKSALINASDAKIEPSAYYSVETETNVLCMPVTTMAGYRDKDDAESIRKNSRSSFSRQNRLVTKEDYKNFILENYSEWKDVTVQNNWEYISTFYGWLYAIDESFVNSTTLKNFNSSDLADANNVYIWVLDKNIIDINNVNLPDEIGIIRNLETGDSDAHKFGNGIGAIKEITVQPIYLNAICKRFSPYILDSDIASVDSLNYDTPDPFVNSSTKPCFRIHIDSNYSNSLNRIEAKTYSLIKSYLFDNIKLGYTPNVPALIKELMSIDGIVNITTVVKIFNDQTNALEKEKEVNGMQFVTWTDTNSVLFEPKQDAKVAYNLPNIPNFQFFKSSQTYKDFIEKSIEFKIDYSINSI